MNITIARYALLTALATWLGSLPFIRYKDVSKFTLWIGNSIAAWFMIAASFTMLREWVSSSGWSVVIGMLIGCVVIVWAHQFLHRYEHLKFEWIRWAGAARILLLFGVMTAHSFTEGIAIGASFGPGESLWILVTIAMALQNIPEWLAICLVMVPKGVSRWRGWLWSIVSSLPQPLMAIPAFMIVSAFPWFLPLSLGFAAGAMIWMSLVELIPDAIENAWSSVMAMTVTMSIIVMMCIELLL